MDKFNLKHERYAQACLSVIVDPRYKDLVHRADGPKEEAPLFPDFLPVEGGAFQVGLEVTWAETDGMGQENKFLSAEFGKGMAAEQMNQDKQKRFKTLKGTAVEVPAEGDKSGVFFDDGSGLNSMSFYEGQVREAIKKKTAILNSADGHTQLFASNELFVQMPFSFRDGDISDILSISKQEIASLSRKFDKTYLSYYNGLWLANPEMEIIRKWVPTKAQLKEIKRISEETPIQL